jgi:hypothetical protein
MAFVMSKFFKSLFQYDSVFTDENMLEIPELSDSSISDIGKITVTENGVNKLLKNLDITKAIGPVLIH